MVLKRSNRSVFGRVIFYTLFVSAGIIIVFNMVFFLQTATELAILKNAGQDKSTFPSLFKEKRLQYAPTSEGKVKLFLLTFSFSIYRIKIIFSPFYSKLEIKNFVPTCQTFLSMNVINIESYSCLFRSYVLQVQSGLDSAVLCRNQRVHEGNLPLM